MKLGKYLVVLASCLLSTGFLLGTAKVERKVVEAVSQLVLKVERTYQLAPRLPDCCPGVKNEYDVLNVLFASIADGTASDATWKAVYRLRDIGDGDWYLEYEGAAYDILESSPHAYHARYLMGDDRAEMLLRQAFEWASDQIEVGVGCEPKWKETAENSEKVLSSALEAIRSAQLPSDGLVLERHANFLDEAKELFGEWKKFLQIHQEWCAERAHEGQ